MTEREKFEAWFISVHANAVGMPIHAAWNAWLASRSACKEEDVGICENMAKERGPAWGSDSRILAERIRASKNILASK